MSALGVFASRFGRYLSIYSAGMAVNLVLGLGTTVVVTHSLDVSDYGRLAVYLMVPTLLMVVANLGLLQGTMRAVFGAHAADDEDGPMVEADDRPEAVRDLDPRDVFATGLAMSLAVAVLGALCVLPFSGALGDSIGGQADGRRMVLIGLAAGVIGSQWRMLVNFQRYAGRPVAYNVGFASRGVFALIATILLLHAGKGLEGAFLALALATVASLLVSLAFALRELRPRFSAVAARAIPEIGAPWIVVGLTFHVVQGMGVVAVTMISGAREAGIYSLALTIARIGAYGVSAFLYAWGPLMKSPLKVAVNRALGERETNAGMLGAYVVAGSVLILGLGMVGDQLVRIAPGSFGSAASLIALLAVTPIARGWYALTYATATHPHKQRFFVRGALVALAVYAGGSALLGPPLGAYGVGIAQAVAFLVPAAGMLFITQRRSEPLPLPWRRLVLAPAICGAAFAMLVVLDPPADLLGLTVRGGIFAATLATLVSTRVLPLAAITVLLRPAGLLRRGRTAHGEMARRVRGLSVPDAELLVMLVRQRRPPAEVAVFQGMTSDEVVDRFAVLLRELADLEDPAALDERISRVLLFNGAVARRLDLMKELVDTEIDPLVLDHLEQTVGQLRTLGMRHWPTPPLYP